MKPFSIVDLEKSKSSSVFVLNKTSGHEKGNVIISVSKKSGQGIDVVLIPSTFIPVNLTEQVSKTQLLDSSDFRSALSSRRLVLIDSDEAFKMLDTKVAQKELDKLYKDKEMFRNNVADLNTIHNEIEDTTGGMREMLSNLDGGTVDGDEVLKVRPVILQLLADLEDLGDEDSALSTLRNVENVTRSEYRYVYKNIPKKFKSIISYAEEQVKYLKKLKADKKAKKLGN